MWRYIDNFLAIAASGTAAQLRIRIHILQRGRFTEDRLERQAYPEIWIIINIIIIWINISRIWFKEL